MRTVTPQWCLTAEAVGGAGEGAYLHSLNQRYLKASVVEVNVLFQAVRVFTKLSETTLAKSQRGSGGEWKLLGVWVEGRRCCLSQTRCLHRSPQFHGMAYCQRETLRGRDWETHDCQ